MLRIQASTSDSYCINLPGPQHGKQAWKSQNLNINCSLSKYNKNQLRISSTLPKKQQPSFLALLTHQLHCSIFPLPLRLKCLQTVWVWTETKRAWTATWQTMALAWRECDVLGSFSWRNLASSNVSSCSLQREMWVFSWRWHFTLLKKVWRAFQFDITRNTVLLLAIYGCKNQIPKLDVV